VALNGVLSSPLPVQAGVPQGSILGPVLFLVFINDLSNSLENPLYRFADDFTLCRDIPHPSDRQAAASSLSSDLVKNHKLVKPNFAYVSILYTLCVFLTPHCGLHPLFIHLRLLSPSALLLLFPFFSCCSLCYVVP